MNSKKEKLIRQHAKQLMIDWLVTVVPEEEKEKINITNVLEYVPNQTHFYANSQLRISSYTLRWFIKGIKKIVNNGRKDFKTISVKEIEHGE